jgi:hypothetical protein
MRRKGGEAAKTPRFYPEDTENLTQSPDKSPDRVGAQTRNAKGEIFDYFPKLWGALTRECGFRIGSLGRGGMSEAA